MMNLSKCRERRMVSCKMKEEKKEWSEIRRRGGEVLVNTLMLEHAF